VRLLPIDSVSALASALRSSWLSLCRSVIFRRVKALRRAYWKSLRPIFQSRGLALVLALAGTGSSTSCASLEVTRINSAESKPNNVWVFFTVEDEKKEPVGGLAASDFEIYEDGEIVSTFESLQTIQNPEVAAVMYTALLLDVSGSVMESGQIEPLIDSAELFAQRVGKQQRVGVFAFDGAEEIYPLVPFTESEASVRRAIEGLRARKTKDPSTNLHGAVVNGLEQLKSALDKDPRPLKFGTLVVFSDGTDRAGRVTREAMNEALAQDTYKDYEIFAIGVGAELEESSLNDIGRDGTELVKDQSSVKEGFDRVAEKIEAHSKRYYLLSYCTPSRNGKHKVRIVANRPEEGGKKGKSGAKGELEYEFDATGFGPPPACDPERAPTFRMDKNLVPVENVELSSAPKAKAKKRKSKSSGAIEADGELKMGDD
jgi:hypothetical protein